MFLLLQKGLKMLICCFQFWVCFLKYFLDFKQTYFHSYFLFSLKMKTGKHSNQVLVSFSFQFFFLFDFAFEFFFQQNRPVNAQNVADALQKFNLKKAAIQKALDNLADGGRISFKEYGKQKIYLARQDQFQIPNTEELNQMKEQNAELQKQLEDQKKATSEVEAGIFSNLNRHLRFEKSVEMIPIN